MPDEDRAGTDDPTGEAAGQALETGASAREHRETLALFALVETVVSSLSLDEVLGRILDQMERFFGARAVWIRLVDEATGRLELKAARGEGTASILKAELRRGQGVAGVAFESRSIAAVPDIQADSRFQNRAAFAAAGINEVIMVPLVVGGRSIGILAYCPAVQGQARHADERLLALLSLFTAHAAVAIQHAATHAEVVRARDQAERLARRLVALQRLEEAAGQAADLPSLLGRAASLAAAALGARHGVVALLEPDGPDQGGPRGRLVLGTAAEAGTDRPLRALPVGRFGSLARLVEDDRRAVVLDAPAEDPRLGRFRRPLATSGAKRLLLAPVVSGGRLLGGLAVHDGDRQQGHEGGASPFFGPEDLALAESFGARLGAAIDRIRLVDSERRRARELLALQRTTQHLASTLSLEGVLAVVIEEATRLLEADAVALRLREGDDLVLVAHSPAIAGSGAPVRAPVGHSMAGLVAARNAPLMIRDLARDRRARAGTIWQQMGLRSYLGVPIRTGDGTAGVLGFYSRRLRRFEAREAALAGTLADVVAVALDNARLFERVSQAIGEWETSFNAMREGIALVGADGRIVRANRSLAELLAAATSDLVGRSFGEVAPGLAPGREAALGGRTLALSVSPLADREGRSVGAVYAVRDVTEERRLHEQLLQSEKLASIGQLVSGVAHELNNPLAAIIGYAELLLRRTGDPALTGDIRQVLAQAERASRIVHNLLSFARKQRPEKRELPLNDVVRAALELQSYDLRVSNIELEQLLDSGLPRVMADFHQLEEVVVNILVNAKQAMPETKRDGRIRVETRAVRRDEGPAARLTIRDNGSGIPKEHLHRIFDPFFTTKPVGVGTGLGLSICFGIVEQHGGRIWVESVPGAGTAVFIELPAATAASPPDVPRALAAMSPGAVPAPVTATEPAPAARAEPGPVGPAPAAASAGAATGRARILVVDDEPTVRQAVAGMLQLDGYDVETAEDGIAAAAHLAGASFDLVLADVKMPGAGGLDLANWIAAHRPAMAGRLVFMTGDTVGASTQALLDASGRPFLPKPFTRAELAAVVSRQLAAARAAVSP